MGTIPSLHISASCICGAHRALVMHEYTLQERHAIVDLQGRDTHDPDPSHKTSTLADLWRHLYHLVLETRFTRRAWGHFLECAVYDRCEIDAECIGSGDCHSQSWPVSKTRQHVKRGRPRSGNKGHETVGIHLGPRLCLNHTARRLYHFSQPVPTRYSWRLERLAAGTCDAVPPTCLAPACGLSLRQRLNRHQIASVVVQWVSGSGRNP